MKKNKIVKNLKLDFGCGPNKNECYFGIDCVKHPGVDLVWNLEKIPYPLPDSCCEHAIASHIVEHIEPHGGVFLNVMNEWWRLMKLGGILEITTPYPGSRFYYMDPTHCNPCNEMTWLYFDPDDKKTKGFFWKIYKPKPWKIMQLKWSRKDIISVVLILLSFSPNRLKPFFHRWNSSLL